jgi:hypothetical protein
MSVVALLGWLLSLLQQYDRSDCKFWHCGSIQCTQMRFTCTG